MRHRRSPTFAELPFLGHVFVFIVVVGAAAFVVVAAMASVVGP